MTAQPTLIAPAVPVQPPAAVEDSCCKKVIRAIEEIALQIFVPLALAIGLYFALPFAVSIVVIPIAVTATIFAMNFFLAKPRPVIAEPVLPLTEKAPAGLRNAGNDCWLNSLAQMIQIDRGMKKWFTEVPNQLDVHSTYFQHFSQDVLEALPPILPPEVYGDLAAGDARRGRIDAYANIIRNKPDAEKENLFNYLRFLRQFPKLLEPNVTPRVVATSLLEFKKFMTVYGEGQRDRPGQALRLPAPPPPAAPAGLAPVEPALYNSHDLRMAIGAVYPKINLIERNGREIDAPNSQQDPTEALRPIFNCLLPNHLKVQTREKMYFELPRNQITGELQPLPDIEAIDGRVIVTNTPFTTTDFPCAINGSYPNIQNFLQRHFEDGTQGNYTSRVVDGVRYQFGYLKVERQFLTAPSSLWFPLNRFSYITSPWIGLHRISDLFEAYPGYKRVRIDEPVECQETIELQPFNGPLAQYELDGFICHAGDTPTSGHYTSYERRVDDQGNPAFFFMNDAIVTRISEARWRAALEKAYIPHYSKIEEQV